MLRLKCLPELLRIRSDRTSHFTSTFISGLLGDILGRGVDTLVKAVPCSQGHPIVQPHYEARAPRTFTEWGSERGLTIYKNWNERTENQRYYISEVIGQVKQLIKYHCLILKFLFKEDFLHKDRQPIQTVQYWTCSQLGQKSWHHKTPCISAEKFC